MYGSRLKELRENRGLTQYAISEYLELNKRVYGQYEREYVTIPIKYLIKICDYLNCSLDYVFSFTDNIKYDDMNEASDKVKVGLRLKEWRKENKITQEKLAEYLHTNRSLLSNYEKGIYLISTSFLYMICKKYKVSADYLLGRIDSPKYLK